MVGSSNRLPIKRFMQQNVFSGLVIAWRFAGNPTKRSPAAVIATIEGVVLPPSWFSTTFASLPSVIATHEFVVPKSIPIILVTCGFGSKPDGNKACEVDGFAALQFCHHARLKLVEEL